MTSVGRDPIVSDFANLLHESRLLTQEEVDKNPTEWIRNKPKDMLPSSQPEKTSVPLPEVKA